MIKYAIIPDYVKSKNDGELHWIDGIELIRLYGIEPRECWIFKDDSDGKDSSLIKLTPRYHGDYREHLAKVSIEFLDSPYMQLAQALRKEKPSGEDFK